MAWCTECGSYADAKAKGLSRPCKGAPDNRLHGGMAGQLRKLYRGQHPRTGERMPAAVDVNGCEWAPGPTAAHSERRYSNLPYYRNLQRDADAAAALESIAWGSLQAAMAAALPVPDVPQVASQLTHVEADEPPPRTARQKMLERLLRVRAKEAQARSQALVTVEPDTGPVVRRPCSTKQAAGW